MKKRKTLWVALFVLVLGLAVVGYLGVNKSLIAPQASTTTTPTCPNKRVVSVYITGQKGQAIGGAKVNVETPDCNRDDSSDSDTKVPFFTSCTTSTSGTYKGQCAVEVKLGNTNYANYYIWATITSGGRVTFRAPTTNFWDKINGKTTKFYLPLYNGAPYSVTIAGNSV